MLSVVKYLEQAVAARASDVFIVAGCTLDMKVGGVIRRLGGEKLFPPETEQLIRELYDKCGRDISAFLRCGDDDFSLAVPGLSRFRISAYRQRGSWAAVIRVVAFDIPHPQELNIPEEVLRIADVNHGMALVTGSAGSGKSTTLACVIDRINRSRNSHIITLEDPIEFLHHNNRSIVSQREISIDTADYPIALRACLRQAPDVILVGEMRDYETISTALTAAETGHLLISTLHTVGATNTIDRIIDVFPPHQQQQVRVQLSMTLDTVISQQLLPDVDGGLIPAFEIMRVTPAIRNMIRESKTFQIDTVIQSSAALGMIGMDTFIFNLYRQGRVAAETAMQFALNAEQMQRKINS